MADNDRGRPLPSPHTRRPETSGDTGADEKDPYDQMLERSGCVKYHHKLQDCFFDKGNDWRKCQKEMKDFRACMSKHQKKRTSG